MDAYERKKFLWMLKLELDQQDGVEIRPAFFRSLVEIGETLVIPARVPWV